MSEKFSMRKPDGKHLGHNIEVQRGKAIGEGSEVKTSQVELYYKDYGRTVGGLVLKKLHASEAQPLWAESQIDEIMRQWRWISDAMKKRKKEGREVFTLPGTIRFYRQGNEQGVLMTDLSKGGKIGVFDMKELARSHSFLHPLDWESIKEQVGRDIRIAEEEHIRLGGGPYPLDPWLIAFEEGGPVAYLVDIGGYTSVNSSVDFVERSTRALLEALEKMDQEFEMMKEGG